MEKTTPTSSVAGTAASPAPEKQTDPSTQACTNNDGEPPLSKNQLKKRRRWEQSAANKKRRKEQSREVRRLKAEKEGRDLNAEREQQIKNEKDGKGWAKREERWKQRIEKADIDNSFRVCFDCSFEDQMSWKEINSLSLQLRYVYGCNRKSSMPVYIDVCGMKKGGQTRVGLEKVEGFPNAWEGRAFRCYEEKLEDVYGGRVIGSAKHEEAGSEGNEKEVMKGSPTKSDTIAESSSAAENDSKNDATDSGEQKMYPKLPPKHQFVYLTGDSPNTLTTLDNNTTYIVGGIVDRNRLKRAAIQRVESINAQYPSLDIQTARLPLEEIADFKGSTRILTCNHVFEILQKYRENGYRDWRSSIMAVLPSRKEVEERDEGKVCITVDGGKKEGS